MRSAPGGSAALLLIAVACSRSATPPDARDAAPAPEPASSVAHAGDACGVEGARVCAAHPPALLRCMGGAFVAVAACAGPGGCAPDGGCDDTIAQAGDPCDVERQVACAPDGASELRCEGRRWRTARACVRPCERLDGGVRCP